MFVLNTDVVYAAGLSVQKGDAGDKVKLHGCIFRD